MEQHEIILVIFLDSQSFFLHFVNFADVNGLLFGAHESSYLTKNALWYLDEFYAWDVVLTPREVFALYKSFPQA